MRIQGSTIANSLKNAFKHLSQRIPGLRRGTQNKTQDDLPKTATWYDLPKTAIAQIFTLLPLEDVGSSENVAQTWKEEGQIIIQQAITDFEKVVETSAIPTISEMIKEPNKRKEFKKILDIFRGLPANERTEVNKYIRKKYTNAQKERIDHLLQGVAEFGNSAHVCRVLVWGADINSANQHGDTALHMAASRTGYAETVQILLEAGANINSANQNGNTALHMASRTGHAETVQILLDAGANVNQTNNEGEAALHEAATWRNTETVIQALLGAGADINSTNSLGDTALHIAAINGRPKNVKALVKRGADVNWPNQNRETALHIATFKGYAETVKALLSAGTDVNWLDQYGKAALHIAALKGNAKIVKALLKAGADINQVNVEGYTALQLAASRGHTDIVEILEKVERRKKLYAHVSRVMQKMCIPK